jgi:hypothetical protein
MESCLVMNKLMSLHILLLISYLFYAAVCILIDGQRIKWLSTKKNQVVIVIVGLFMLAWMQVCLRAIIFLLRAEQASK